MNLIKIDKLNRRVAVFFFLLLLIASIYSIFSNLINYVLSSMIIIFSIAGIVFVVIDNRIRETNYWIEQWVQGFLIISLLVFCYFTFVLHGSEVQDFLQVIFGTVTTFFMEDENSHLGAKVIFIPLILFIYFLIYAFFVFMTICIFTLLRFLLIKSVKRMLQ